MAYKRPLSPRQSYIIALLWLGFALLFLSKARITAFSLLAFGASALIVFYPIYKSYKERHKD